MNIMIILLIVLSLASLLTSLLVLARAKSSESKIESYLKAYGDIMSQSQRNISDLQDIRLKELSDNMIRLKNENSRQIDNIRETVDEKLQETLENRISKSFGLVNERLEQVYKGIGEMQSIASGVTDLKRILSNVKTRGILGEVQLSAILEQILSKEQYEQNVATKKGSSARVEFAIKMPADGKNPVYLPIDAKFPGDTYNSLLDAYDLGEKEQIIEARKQLTRTIEAEAKDISSKYIDVPHTTEFAVMFLPFEGLYAEVVRAGMIEVLQRKYKVTIAGPTTMAAFLNSLQMGFNTIAIEKRSSDVWKLLGAVKTEFERFESVITDAKKHMEKANQDFDILINTRFKQMKRKLLSVTELSHEESAKYIDED